MTLRCLRCHEEVSDINAKECPTCKWPITADYRATIAVNPPLWIAVAGYTRHGKTTLLDMLTLTLNALPRQVSGTFAQALDERTYKVGATVAGVAGAAGSGADAQATNKAESRILLLRNFGPFGDRAVSFTDTKGEWFNPHAQYHSTEDTAKKLPVLGIAGAVWLVVSLPELEEEESKQKGWSIRTLFEGTHRALQAAGSAPSGGRKRRMVVVYTMADRCRYDGEIENYVQKDEFGRLTTAPLHEQLKAEKLENYLPGVFAQSARLKAFTELAVNDGRAFLTMAQSLGYELEFAATTDIGDAPATNDYQGRPRAPLRVLDPLMLSFVAEQPPLTKHRFAVIVDGTTAPGPVYTKGLPQAFHTLLKKYGEVTVYYLGHPRPESHPGQQAPTETSRVPRLRLIGPILDALDKQDAAARRPDHLKWRAVVATNGAVIDLQDFTRGWSERLLLVRTDLQTTDERWDLLTRYRETDTPEVALGPLLEIIRSKSG